LPTGSLESMTSPGTQRRLSGEFVEVTPAEFESVSPTIRGRVTLRDVNIVRDLKPSSTVSLKYIRKT